MSQGGMVRVRLIRDVTHGNVSWRSGQVVVVAADLADLMVQEGEAVKLLGLDTTMAVGITPARTR